MGWIYHEPMNHTSIFFVWFEKFEKFWIKNITCAYTFKRNYFKKINNSFLHCFMRVRLRACMLSLSQFVFVFVFLQDEKIKN